MILDLYNLLSSNFCYFMDVQGWVDVKINVSWLRFQQNHQVWSGLKFIITADCGAEGMWQLIMMNFIINDRFDDEYR